jgi:hypothetical protein
VDSGGVDPEIIEGRGKINDTEKFGTELMFHLMCLFGARARRPRGRSSSSDRVKNFLFSMSFRPALGPTQPPIEWVPGAVSPEVKRLRREDNHY